MCHVGRDRGRSRRFRSWLRGQRAAWRPPRPTGAGSVTGHLPTLPRPKRVLPRCPPPRRTTLEREGAVQHPRMPRSPVNYSVFRLGAASAETRLRCRRVGDRGQHLLHRGGETALAGLSADPVATLSLPLCLIGVPLSSTLPLAGCLRGARGRPYPTHAVPQWWLRRARVAVAPVGGESSIGRRR